MAFAFSSAAANGILNYVFGKSSSSLSALSAGARSIRLYTSADVLLGACSATFGVASSGVTLGTGGASTMSAGTIAKAQANFFSSGGSSSNETSGFLTAGVAGSGADVIVTTVSGGGLVSITNCNFAVLASSSDGVKLNTALRNVIADLYRSATSGLVQLVTGTTGSTAYLRLYSGSPPASADTAATGTLLWEREMLAADFNSASGGAISLVSTHSVNAAATGTVGYGRLERASGAGLQFTVATDTSAHVQIDTLSAVSGSPLVLQSFSLALV